MKLRSHLIVLMVGTLLPMVLLAIAGTLWLIERERATFERGATERVRAVLTAVDSELHSPVTALEALAALRQISDGNLRAVHEELVRALASQPDWLGLSLADTSGQQLLNARHPYGGKLPVIRERESLERCLRAGRPAVGNMEPVPDGTGQQFSIRVPVKAGGKIQYVLSAAINPKTIATLIQAQLLPSSWIGVVVDGDMRFVSRSINNGGALLGDRVSESLHAALAAGWEGWFRGTTVEGLDVYTSFSTSEFSGWSVALAIPASEVDAARRGSAYLLAGGTTLAVLVAVLVALWLGGRFSAPVVQLASAAKNIGSDPWPAKPMLSQVDEVRDLGVALQKSVVELQRADAAQRYAIDQLRATDKAKDEFLAMLGHELRNPLAAIAGASSVLGTSGIRDDMAERARSILRRQLENLSRLVDDLLDVSRTTAGKVALVRRPVDLSAIVGATLGAFRSSGRLQGHMVSSRLSPVWINADELRIEQVVSNLLGNALKFTPTGGRISVEVQPMGTRAVLRVSDSGAGIAPDLIDKVFESFVQGSNPIDRAQGGLGLGLALVRALVGLHGGSVKAESAGPGQGAAFTVRLPSISQPAVRAVASESKAERGRKLRRILIVEDNRDGREALCALLGLAGHDVHEAEDGLSGVEAVEKLSPDLALIDIGLPGIDGYEVARRIRALRQGRDIRLVAISGYGQPDDRRRAMEAGFDAHLTKPVAMERLNEFLVH
jgi:signal transduction histidine kinase